MTTQVCLTCITSPFAPASMAGETTGRTLRQTNKQTQMVFLVHGSRPTPGASIKTGPCLTSRDSCQLWSGLGRLEAGVSLWEAGVRVGGARGCGQGWGITFPPKPRQRCHWPIPQAPQNSHWLNRRRKPTVCLRVSAWEVCRVCVRVW